VGTQSKYAVQCHEQKDKDLCAWPLWRHDSGYSLGDTAVMHTLCWVGQLPFTTVLRAWYYFTPILQMGKLRDKTVVLGHTASNWQSQDLSLDIWSQSLPGEDRCREWNRKDHHEELD
jgi:hypothetical protein